MTIDIGVIHLGLCVAEISEDFSTKNIVWVDLIDITHFRHRSDDKCTLHHTRNFADWVEHFVQDHRAFFDASDLILIEKQPPMGFVVVEQLLFSKFREKTQLLSPRQIHCYFNFAHLDYDKRKEFAEKIADRELPEHLLEQTHFYSRRHDIADSVCMLIYWMRKKETEWRRKKRMEALTRDTSGLTVMEKLELFKYL
jgi:hypothetical protein